MPKFSWNDEALQRMRDRSRCAPPSRKQSREPDIAIDAQAACFAASARRRSVDHHLATASSPKANADGRSARPPQRFDVLLIRFSRPRKRTGSVATGIIRSRTLDIVDGLEGGTDVGARWSVETAPFARLFSDSGKRNLPRA